MLPAHAETNAIFAAAIERDVAGIAGSAFAMDGGRANSMRLNFTNVRPETTCEVIASPAEVIRAQCRESR